MMKRETFKRKAREWLRRYLIAEIFGTAIAVGAAYFAFQKSGSYAAAAGAGWAAEGIGFYGYFITKELITNGKAYGELPIFRRVTAIITKSSANLLVEFAPAEILDNIFVRPLLMFYVPQHLRPYALGFLVAKLAADALFYVLAIVGYEIKNAFCRRKALK